MYDSPFRVVRSTRTTNGCAHITCWAIVRTSEDTICYVDDVTWAYRIVEALNHEEENAQRISAFNRRVHQGGDNQRLPDAPSQ